MDDFFRQRDALSIPGERGDKFVISTSQSDFKNIEPDGTGSVRITREAKYKVQSFIRILADATRWEFAADRWSFGELTKYRFSKGSFEADRRRINNSTFHEFIVRNPLSWAMTSGQNIEYTLETPSSLP
jgi:hypothetical protein